MRLSPKTKVDELLSRYPFLKNFLIQLDPHFKALDNPLLRKTLGKVATLSKVAMVGGIEIETLINKIAQEIKKEAGEAVLVEGEEKTDRGEETGRRAAPSQERLAEEDTETFRIEVGYVHGVKPGNIVGAIAKVAGLEGRQIGHVDIREDHTFVGLPRGMPDAVMRELAKTRVAGQMLRISTVSHVPPKPLRKPLRRPAAGTRTPRNR